MGQSSSVRPVKGDCMHFAGACKLINVSRYIHIYCVHIIWESPLSEAPLYTLTLVYVLTSDVDYLTTIIMYTGTCMHVHRCAGLYAKGLSNSTLHVYV